MYRVKKIEDVHPTLIAGILKTIKDIRKPSKEDNAAEELSLSQLWDQAEDNRRRLREEWEEERQREINKSTEEVAKMFQDKIKGTLEEIGNNLNPVIDGKLKYFGEYGSPETVRYNLNAEKFEIIYDFSDKYHTRDVRMTLNHCSPYANNYMPHYPREFAFGKSISWEYLEKLLEKENIKISREQDRNEEKISYDDTLVTTKDIITVTVDRKNIKDKTPVITEEPQKVKAKRKGIFSNLIH